MLIRKAHIGRPVLCLLFFLFLLVFPLRSPAATPAEPADLILQHGTVYKVDAARTWAQAVAVRNRRIVFVGSDEDITKFRGPATRVVDLEGRMVLPGFIDSHIHVILAGRYLALCNLNEAHTQADALRIVQKCASDHPKSSWVNGAGWELPVFPGANPSKELLDQIVPDRPVFLKAADGHSAWANSKALALAGITRSTPDPPNGRIEHDLSTGEPSGTLRESAAVLVSTKIPKPSAKEVLEGLKRGLGVVNQFGITSFQDPSVDEVMLEAYHEADVAGWLSAHVVGAMTVSPSDNGSQVNMLVTRRKRYQGQHFSATAVKFFADGVIESGTAALLQPYVGRLAGTSGNLNFQPERLNRLMIELYRAGFQIHVHAIGDRAVRVSLDGLEAAQKATGQHDLRPQIAHLELVDPEDIRRFRRLKIIANFQPLWAYADSYIKDLTLPVLGPQRSRWLYPIGSMVRSGAVVVGGSDWPVSSCNPLEAIQVAITRIGLDNSTSDSWIPEERVDLATMIAAYTINGAWDNHLEQETGSIEVGKFADLTVLSQNLFDIPSSEIHKTRVLLTLLEGHVVWQDPSVNVSRNKK
jgi:predicted amidohydrolase YtcJ